jgi:DNA-binding NtrC family response regulator
LQQTCEETGKGCTGFSEEALGAMQRYNWPGNVRELQNVVERAVLLGRGPQIYVEDLPNQMAVFQPQMACAALSAQHLKAAMANPERAIILQMLEANHWNRNKTADALGINRTTLYKKMKRLGLDRLPQAVGPG